MHTFNWVQSFSHFFSTLSLRKGLHKLTDLWVGREQAKFIQVVRKKNNCIFWWKKTAIGLSFPKLENCHFSRSKQHMARQCHWEIRFQQDFWNETVTVKGWGKNEGWDEKKWTGLSEILFSCFKKLMLLLIYLFILD